MGHRSLGERPATGPKKMVRQWTAPYPAARLSKNATRCSGTFYRTLACFCVFSSCRLSRESLLAASASRHECPVLKYVWSRTAAAIGSVTRRMPFLSSMSPSAKADAPCACCFRAVHAAVSKREETAYLITIGHSVRRLGSGLKSRPRWEDPWIDCRGYLVPVQRSARLCCRCRRAASLI